MPAASLRSIPALSISLWLTISASAGDSLLVRRWNRDRRIGLVSTEGRAFCHAFACGRPARTYGSTRRWWIRTKTRASDRGESRPSLGRTRSAAFHAGMTRGPSPGSPHEAACLLPRRRLRATALQRRLRHLQVLGAILVGQDLVGLAVGIGVHQHGRLGL